MSQFPEKLAYTFSVVLKEWLTPEEMQTVVSRNATPEYGAQLCASHDFCDANMAMQEAFIRLFKRTPDTNSELDSTLWNQAWYIAKEHAFYSTQ